MGRSLFEDVGRRPNVILMPVSKQVAANVIPLAHQVGYIRNNEINTQHIFLGEDAAAVNHNNIIAVFQHGHVLADFIDTAQGNNSKFPHFVRCSAHLQPPFGHIRSHRYMEQSSCPAMKVRAFTHAEKPPPPAELPQKTVYRYQNLK